MNSLDGDSVALGEVSVRYDDYLETAAADDRGRYPIGSLADLGERPDFPVVVPVVAFDLPASVRLPEFIAAAFQPISVRLVSRGVCGHGLSVTGRRRLAAVESWPAS